MANKKVPEDLLLQAAEIMRQYPTYWQAEKATGIPRYTLKYRHERAALSGLLGFDPVLPGFAVTSTSTITDKHGEVTRRTIRQAPERHSTTFEVPPGHNVKGVSALTDASGNIIQQWTKTTQGVLDPLQLAERLQETFAKFKPAAKPKPAPRVHDDDLLTLYPFGDWHVGMYAWDPEAPENWDLSLAEDRIGNAAEAVIERSRPSTHCVLLGGGDLLHADNKRNETANSGHTLDVDGRYQKVVDVALRLMIRTVDACLRRHQHVTVRLLQGNHDEHSAIVAAFFIKAWYRNEPRVTVDTSPSLFWEMRFGKVMLAATHGHTVKAKDMPAIMAHRWPEDWGKTRFRYAHTFHLHHTEKMATEGMGVITEIHRAPIPQDAWHYNSGFLSGRSMKSITYHRSFGDLGSTQEAVLDAKEEAADE